MPDWLAGSNKGLDQVDGILVLGEIPHRAMATRVEDGVEVFLLDAVEANGLIELSFRRGVLLEADREISTGFGFVALGIERRTAAFRRCERDLDAGVLENVVGSRRLFEPKSRVSPSITQLVVGCDNHQHFHDCHLCLLSSNEPPVRASSLSTCRASRRDLEPPPNGGCCLCRQRSR